LRDALANLAGLPRDGLPSDLKGAMDWPMYMESRAASSTVHLSLGVAQHLKHANLSNNSIKISNLKINLSVLPTVHRIESKPVLHRR